MSTITLETPESLNLLVVDDEANIRRTLSFCLEAAGYHVESVSNSVDAIDAVRQRTFDAAFVDLRLGAEDGLELIPRLLAEAPWVQVVVLTAHASVTTAVEAMRRGASDYIAKPFEPEQIRQLARGVLRVRDLRQRVAALTEATSHLDAEPELTSTSATMARAVDTAQRAAASEAVILLAGESGTGKSVLARAVHGWSPRSARPLVVVSCPAVADDLFESELFGHVRGAFTGAVRDNPGRIAAAEGGTLFLDEVADLPLTTQSKLLRFVQERLYERVGDPAPRRADVRLLAATNADLAQRVADGRFREDLRYRLDVIRIEVPPLRQRPGDITALATRFLAHFARANRRPVVGFTEAALAALSAYAWPGNVRELRNTVERAVILGRGDLVDLHDLPEPLTVAALSPGVGDAVPLATIEELHIRRVMAASSSLQAAARTLGIDQATLWRRRKLYGI